MKLFSKKIPQIEVDELVRVKLEWICSHSSPLKIILFGSASTGEMTEASDIDLIVIYSDATDLKKISYDLAKSRPKDDWPHDLIMHTESSFIAAVAKGGGASWVANQDGKIIFERINQ